MTCAEVDVETDGSEAANEGRGGHLHGAQGIVEPVIGQIKHARGFRQFLLGGFEKVQGEWALVCMTHNILKLYRLYV